jgi:hypothetical protein
MTITYLPLTLLLGLGVWTASATYALAPRSSLLPPLAAVGASVTLGILGTLRPEQWLDRASLLLMSTGFLWMGIFVLDLGIWDLYLFMALTILTAHLMRFRTTALPLRGRKDLDESILRGLQSVYLAALLRGTLVALLVFLVSIMVFVAAGGTVLPLTTELTAFLWALAVLLILLTISTLPRQSIRLKY